MSPLSAKGFEPDDNDMYLYKMPGMQMIWPYDDRGRLAGEYQWEPEPSQAEVFKLNPRCTNCSGIGQAAGSIDQTAPVV